MEASIMASSMCWPPAPLARATRAAHTDWATFSDVTLSHTIVFISLGAPSLSACTTA